MYCSDNCKTVPPHHSVLVSHYKGLWNKQSTLGEGWGGEKEGLFCSLEPDVRLGYHQGNLTIFYLLTKYIEHTELL